MSEQIGDGVEGDQVRALTSLLLTFVDASEEGVTFIDCAGAAFVMIATGPETMAQVTAQADAEAQRIGAIAP